MQETDKTTETLARMWIDCDPNRMGGELGSGFHPEDPIQQGSEDLVGQPRWKWFVPRAEASIKYLKDRGYKIVRA